MTSISGSLLSRSTITFLTTSLSSANSTLIVIDTNCIAYLTVSTCRPVDRGPFFGGKWVESGTVEDYNPRARSLNRKFRFKTNGLFATCVHATRGCAVLVKHT